MPHGNQKTRVIGKQEQAAPREKRLSRERPTFGEKFTELDPTSRGIQLLAQILGGSPAREQTKASQAQLIERQKERLVGGARRYGRAVRAGIQEIPERGLIGGGQAAMGELLGRPSLPNVSEDILQSDINAVKKARAKNIQGLVTQGVPSEAILDEAISGHTMRSGLGQIGGLNLPRRERTQAAAQAATPQDLNEAIRQQLAQGISAADLPFFAQRLETPQGPGAAIFGKRGFTPQGTFQQGGFLANFFQSGLEALTGRTDLERLGQLQKLYEGDTTKSQPLEFDTPEEATTFASNYGLAITDFKKKGEKYTAEFKQYIQEQDPISLLLASLLPQTVGQAGGLPQAQVAPGIARPAISERASQVLREAVGE